MRLGIRGILGLLACSLALAAHADDAVEPYEEYINYIRAAQEVAPLTDTVFGDHVALYTGVTDFDITDVSLPGNSALPVALTRRFEIRDLRQQPVNGDGLQGFGDWELDVPYIDGMFGQTYGWMVVTQSGMSNSRCSDNTDSPVSSGHTDISDVWNGNELHIPGQGDQELLANTQPKSPAYASAGTYKWVTTGNWRVSCIGSVANMAGEGFVAVSPSGVSYTFNYAVINDSSTYDRGGSENSRSRIFLLATQVQDRFGNWVKYNYSNGQLQSITSSDGRNISIGWSGSEVASVTSEPGTSAQQTWQYGYSTASDVDAKNVTHTWPYLSSVTRPDGSQWTYSVLSGSLITSVMKSGDGPPPGPQCQAALTPLQNTGAFSYQVGAPSGATATYTFNYQRNMRDYVPTGCINDPQHPTHDYPVNVTAYFDNFQLTQKQISGPGLAPQTWTYCYVCDDGPGGGSAYFTATVPFSSIPVGTEPYEPSGACSPACAPSKFVTVTGPTNVTKYSFGIQYARNEGQLLSTEVDDLSGNPLKTTTYVYVSDSDAPNESFSDIAGYDLVAYEMSPMGNRNRPVVATQITQDGANFTTAVNSNCSGSLDCFDAFARVTSETETGSASRTTTTSYYDDLSRWVLGQVSSTSVLGTAVPCTSGTSGNTALSSCTIYSNTSDLPLNSYAFGKLVSTKAWHASDGTDQAGTLSSVTDGDNNTTTLSSWYRGIPRSIQYADATTQSAVVNAAGQITSVTDQNLFTTNYQYDAMDRISEIDYPTSDDVAWNATTISFAPYSGIEYGIPAGHWKQTIQTGAGKTVTMFDAFWRPLVTESMDTNNVSGTLSQTVKRYDAGGRNVFTSYPLSNTSLDYSTYNTGSHNSFDALDRLTRVQADSELGTLTTSTQYLSGFQTQVTNPRGYATTTSYITYGVPDTSQPAQINYANGDYTTITRDIFGKPIWLKRNGTGYEFFVYDANQQLCKRSDMGIVSFYAYDGAGNLSWGAAGLNANGNNTCSDVTQANAGPHLVQRTYDLRNRLKTLSFSDGNGNQSLTYTPDGLPNQITTTNIAGGVSTATYNTYTYDKRRLMTAEGVSVTGQFNWAVGYGYDANGHLSTRYTPSGQTYFYQPDGLGRPTELGIQNVNTYVYNIGYAPNGHIAQFEWTNSVTHQVSENLRGLPSEIEDSNGANIQMDMTYTYDPNGNPSHITDAVSGARTASLQYDMLDRLNSAQIATLGSTPTTYQYNPLDQITQTALGSHTQTFTYGTSNGRPDELYSVIDSQTGTTSYTYDQQGNLATRNGMQYQFDYGNRLRNVVSAEGSYAYDGYGRRVQQTNSSGTIDSFYDNSGALIYQQDRGGGSHDYLYLQGHLVAVRDYAGGIATQMRYQDTDAQGSIIRQTDSSGNQYPYAGAGPVYDAWGKQIGGLAQDGPGYTGHVMDQSTNLIYMQQRYYDPTVGRFLSMDPVDASNADGSNLDRYWYASDNPERNEDPNGLCTGSHIEHGGMCDSTGGFTTGTNGAMQGMMIEQARARESDEFSKQSASQQSRQTQCNAMCSSSHVDQAYQAIDKYKIEGEGYSIEYDNDQAADGRIEPNGTVILGPSAYKSDSWLGSTLGHEIEVHWDRQIQLFGPWKTYGNYYSREIEAYKYEIQNFKRFGNSPEEQKEVYDRLEYNEKAYEYYKDKDIF